MKLKRHPLLVAALLVMLGGICGAIAATIIYKPHDRELRMRAEREGIKGKTADFDEAAFAYAVIGTAIGSFVGLVSGVVFYVKAKAQETETLSLVSGKE